MDAVLVLIGGAGAGIMNGGNGDACGSVVLDLTTSTAGSAAMSSSRNDSAQI